MNPTLFILTHWAARGICAGEDLVDLYDNACKASPNHEELAGQTFLKMARAGMYQRQQQVSARVWLLL